MTFNIEAFSDVPFQLGEGPHWHPALNRLYFVDLLDGLAATIDATQKVQVLLKESDPVSAVLPVDGQPDQVVVSVGTSLFLLNAATGERTLLDKLDKEGVRFNDAKCDPQGNLWIGTMGLESAPAVLEPEKGSLYTLSPGGGKLAERMAKVSLSNGLAWSLDGQSLYYIDSVKRLIYVFDFDGTAGSIANRRVLVNMDEDDAFTSAELPDGMTIDASGNLWVAMFNGARIANIDGKSGKVLQSIQMPTSMITSVCFGGAQLDEMYVTSASKLLDAERKAKEPLAGYIFKVTSPNKDFRGFQANFNLKL